MGKNQFFAELSRLLNSRYNRRDAKSIFCEYQSFFENGLKEGKTETELCQSFGNPYELVMSLRNEYKPPLMSLFFVKRLAVLIVFVFLFLVARDIFDCNNTVELITLCISGFCLWFLLGGNAQSLPPYVTLKPISNRAMFHRTLHGLTIIAVTLSLAYHLNVARRFNEGVVPALAQLQFVLLVFIALMLLFVGIGLYGVFRICPEYYCLVCHAGGGLFSALYVQRFYAILSESEILLNSIIFNYTSYIIGMITAIIFSVFIRKLRRQEG